MSCLFRRNLLCATMGTIVGTFAPALFAQVTTVDVTGSANQAPIEEIIVTGTSIRGISPVGAEPVQYDRADIEADAPVDIRDALSNVPQISNFGTESDMSTENRFRTAGYIPVIHGMEIGSTLSLFNGHRMTVVGTEQVYPDPSAIPSIALERVEIIADGSSAIYGADAVAGVVNFLYRRGIDGFEVDASKGLDSNTSWETTKFSALAGKTFDRGEFMVAYEYMEELRPRYTEFDWAASADQTARGGHDHRSSTRCEYPRVDFNGTFYYGPDLGTEPYLCSEQNNVGTAANGERNAVLATARFDFNDTVEGWAEVNYSKLDTWRDYRFGTISATVPSSSPYFVVPPGADPTEITEELIRRSSIGLYGESDRVASSEFKAVTLGLDIDMGDSWMAAVRASKSQSDDYHWFSGYDAFALQDLITAGEINPFSTSYGENDQSLLNSTTKDMGTQNYGTNTLTELEFKADGPLMGIPGGDIMAAIGANFRGESIDQVQLEDCDLNTCDFSDPLDVSRNDKISRSVNALFVEFAVPLVSGFNDKPGIEDLSLALAGRYDKYQELPGQFNPHVGITWNPVNSLSIHGSWGTSYIAPNLGQLGDYFAMLQDVTYQGIDYRTFNIAGGNPDLEPETATTVTFGFTWEPEFLDGLSVGVTRYDTEYENTAYKIARGDNFTPGWEAYRQVAPAGTFFDEQVILDLAKIYVPTSDLVDADQYNLIVDSRPVNLGSRSFAGFDYNVRYDFDSNLGQWGLALIATNQTERYTYPSAGGLRIDETGTNKSPEWKSRFQVQWAGNNVPLRASWIANYTSGYTDLNMKAAGDAGDALYSANSKIDNYLVHNLAMSYDMDYLDGVTLQARIRNVFDTEPPFFDDALGYDADNARPYGRQIDLILRARF